MQIYTSSYPTIPVPEESIFSFLLRRHLDKSPLTSPAFVDAGTGFTITRGELRDLAFSVGWGLRNHLTVLGGVQLHRGDVAMIFSPNSIAWPVMFFGGIAAGLRMTLANSAYTARELRHQWEDSGAKVVFVHPDLLPIVQQMFREKDVDLTEASRHIIIADWPAPARSGSNDLIRIADLIGKGQLEQEEQFNGPASNETVLLCYSSGTTGKPKGVETTHRNLVTEVLITRTGFPQRGESKPVMLGVLPYYHIYGATQLLQYPFFHPMPVIVMPRFDVVELCKAIERYQVTQILVVPPMCLALWRHPVIEQYNIKSLRLLVSGAAPLGKPMVEGTEGRLRALGADVVLSQGYGLTETSPSSHCLPPDDTIRKAGSVGPLWANLEARLVLEDGSDAKEGEPGELWLRGPTVMKGYLNNPKATAESITPDGWFKTGDIAIRDDEGYYYIVDRRKELIKYKGFQVAPAELEAVLLQHPEIADCAVVGVVSEAEATELPRAYVVHAKGLEPSQHAVFAKQVQDWLKPRVARHKELRGGVFLTDIIPKSAAGKILRRELRDRAKNEPIVAAAVIAKL
ncbi:AMP binding protein [Trametopsis cervina]|nr:AMP binding protein [Trametopsis cervina]